jgi:hypothetical protein
MLNVVTFFILHDRTDKRTNWVFSEKEKEKKRNEIKKFQTKSISFIMGVGGY